MKSLTAAFDLAQREPLVTKQDPNAPVCKATLADLEVDARTGSVNDTVPHYQCKLCGWVGKDQDFAHRFPMKRTVVPAPVELPPMEECGIYGCKTLKPRGALLCADCRREMQKDPEAFK